MITLEDKKRLSESLLWTCQASYYSQMGIDAWSEDVPFFATCNNYIANSYARLISSYIKDYLTRGELDLTQPVYIIELGAGSGQLSFYCASQLLQLKQQLQLDIDICYVMTDFAEDNIAFWRKQEVLQPLFAAGALDCAVYDLQQPRPIKLCYRERVLHEKTVTNPLIVIANYVVDTTSEASLRPTSMLCH